MYIAVVLYVTHLAWVRAATVDEFSPQEQAVVAALLAKTAAQEETSPHAAKDTEPTQVSEIPVPTAPVTSAPTDESAVALTPTTATDETPSPEEQTAPEATASSTCLPVAFIDIDMAFDEHPRTVAVKEQIRQKILTKEEEVKEARQQIEWLATENAQLAAQLRELKPFYERIVIEPQPLLPKIVESADTLEMTNVLNRLTFSHTDTLSASPLNTPAQLEEITARISSNKQTIAQRNFFIDNYRYTTREEILKLEQKEVNEILQDIYKEIKSFAQKRNIGVVVRKDEILYGAKPVNVTKDFINRLKKSRKYRKRGK